MRSTPPTARPALPAGIWVLGFVSLLMDVSSEMVHSLLPLFLVGGLGVSMLSVGLIEGVAEATALIVKVFSGTLSDWLGRRKGLAVLGYAMGAASKPVFAIATSVGMVAGARFVDRIGKGIRGAPRDALVADLAPPGQRGAAFGLRQSLDTVGAFTGPLLATGLMLAWHNDFRAVFWVAALPGALAVALLIFGVHEPPRLKSPVESASEPASSRRWPLQREDLRRLGAPFWRVTAIGAVFTLARFSEAFLVLRANDLGLALAWVPLVMVGMNAVYAATAYPVGRLADGLAARAANRAGHRGRLALAPEQTLLALGLLALVAADAVLALATDWPALLAGVALWGLHMGMSQGLLSAMVADTAPAARRGTAFGVYNLLSGLAMLLASAIAGLLWDRLGAAATFWSGAGLAAAACGLLLTVGRQRPDADALTGR